MLCPTCNDPLTLTDYHKGLLTCQGCRYQWMSVSIISNVSAAITDHINDIGFPGDAVDQSISCRGCGGVGSLEQHVNPDDPSEGFESITCPDCNGKGRQV